MINTRYRPLTDSLRHWFGPLYPDAKKTVALNRAEKPEGNATQPPDNLFLKRGCAGYLHWHRFAGSPARVFPNRKTQAHSIKSDTCAMAHGLCKWDFVEPRRQGEVDFAEGCWFAKEKLIRRLI